MSDWKVKPAVRADEPAYVYADKQYICECKPTPHEVACANFAQNRRAESIADSHNALAGIPNPAKFVDDVYRLMDTVLASHSCWICRKGDEICSEHLAAFTNMANFRLASPRNRRKRNDVATD